MRGVPVRVAMYSMLPILVLASIAAMGDMAMAEPFSGEMGAWDAATYDFDVASASGLVHIDVDPALTVRVYNPRGTEVATDSMEDINGLHVSFHPDQTGTYSYSILGGTVPLSYTGQCSYDVELATVHFGGNIGHRENITYEIDIRDPNKPLIVTVSWQDHYDRIYLDLFDPTSSKRNPDMDGSFTGGRYIWSVGMAGTYELVVKGSRITAKESAVFNATSNYPISRVGAGGSEDEGVSMALVAGAGGGVAIGAIAAVGVWTRVKKRREEKSLEAWLHRPREEPKDYSYLSEEMHQIESLRSEYQDSLPSTVEAVQALQQPTPVMSTPTAQAIERAVAEIPEAPPTPEPTRPAPTPWEPTKVPPPEVEPRPAPVVPASSEWEFEEEVPVTEVPRPALVIPASSEWELEEEVPATEVPRPPPVIPASSEWELEEEEEVPAAEVPRPPEPARPPPATVPWVMMSKEPAPAQPPPTRPPPAPPPWEPEAPTAPRPQPVSTSVAQQAWAPVEPRPAPAPPPRPAPAAPAPSEWLPMPEEAPPQAARPPTTAPAATPAATPTTPALPTCRGCGRPIDPKALACPHCATLR